VEHAMTISITISNTISVTIFCTVEHPFNELTDVYIPTSNVQTILMTSDSRYWKILSICSHAPFTLPFLFSPHPLSADHHKVDLARDHQSAATARRQTDC